MTAAFLLSLAILLAATPVPISAADADPETWGAWYSVSARVRGARADADLVAGGRLSMAGSRSPSGALHLTLRSVLEHPWKFYWVDPLGPFGEEVKVASVVTLPEATWSALEIAEAENAAEGATRHRQWLEHAERPAKLDGTFAFVVVGDALDRFQIDVDVDGSVSSVSNRMTDRWLAGPFDQFVGGWGDVTGDGAPEAEARKEGYWFWNRGEREPFDYEPHTYHAFAAALELLALPLPQPARHPGAGDESVRWLGVGDRATRVLTTLAPHTLADAASVGREPAVTLRVTRAPLPGGANRLVLTSSLGPGEPHIERETVFSSEGWPVSDRIRVRLAAKRGGGLEIEAGYRSRDFDEELK